LKLFFFRSNDKDQTGIRADGLLELGAGHKKGDIAAPPYRSLQGATELERRRHEQTRGLLQDGTTSAKRVSIPEPGLMMDHRDNVDPCVGDKIGGKLFGLDRMACPPRGILNQIGCGVVGGSAILFLCRRAPPNYRSIGSRIGTLAQRDRRTKIDPRLGRRCREKTPLISTQLGARFFYRLGFLI